MSCQMVLKRAPSLDMLSLIGSTGQFFFLSFINGVKEAGATTRRDSPFQGTWKVNPEYLESL